MRFLRIPAASTVICLFLALVTLDSCGQNSENSGANRQAFRQSNPQFAPLFESGIRTVYNDFNVAGEFLFAVVDENGLAYSYVLNDDILNGRASTVDENSPIYVASQTKAFTGTLLSILNEEGIIDLDKSIRVHLPELTLQDSVDTEQITVRRLLNHTHGIHGTPFIWKTAFLGYGGTNRELIDDLNADFLYDPSGRFRYSNAGPIIAGMIVDAVTGNSWKDEMKKRIFLPLDMKNTSTNVSDYEINTIVPSLTVTKNNEVFYSGFDKEDLTMHAAGGILSTINDLAKWLRANINHDERILKTKRSWEAMHEATTTQDRMYFTSHRFAYSLGWDITAYRGDTILSRFGGYGGISFHASFIPARKTGVIAFSNDSRAVRLPHLAANYAYNLLKKTPDAGDVFESEKKMFAENFERNSNQPLPAENDRLKPNAANDGLVGHYVNDVGWPDIEIQRADSVYLMRWGVLEGAVYAIPDPEQPYIGALGVLDRTFAVHDGSLFTGSLKYSREEKKEQGR